MAGALEQPVVVAAEEKRVEGALFCCYQIEHRAEERVVDATAPTDLDGTGRDVEADDVTS